MALAAKTARFALGRTIIDAQFLADSVIFMNSKYDVQRYVRHWSRLMVTDRSETDRHVFTLKLSTLLIIGNNYFDFIYFLISLLVVNSVYERCISNFEGKRLGG